MLKNYFSLTAIFAIFAMAFVSCNTSDNEYELTEPIAVNLRANINPATTRVINDQWQTNDQVGLFMVRTGQTLSATSVLTNANNTLMTIENGVLISNPPIMYPLTGNIDFIAYYPFTSSVDWNFTIPVNVSSQKAGLPTEVLFSNNITNQAPTTSAVTLNFHYSLAKLELRITGGANSTLTETDFANMTVSIEGMYTQANLQLANGTFANHSGKQAITLNSASSNATSASFEALVLPTNAEITFLFDVAGTVYRHTLTANYVAANLYRLNFALDFSTFPEPTATLLNAVIIPRDENVQNITVDAIPCSVVINGVRWATRNVGAPGTFVDRVEDVGMFFQWNRRVGWSSTNPMINSDGGTIWDDTYSDGTAWYAENDPCPTGWRVPTQAELQSLLDAGSNWLPYYNGVNGRLFGTAPNQIFLPAASMRFAEEGLLPFGGGTGWFWSSTQGTYSTWAWRLRIDSNSTQISSSHNRAEGLSVRCVAE